MKKVFFLLFILVSNLCHAQGYFEYYKMIHEACNLSKFKMMQKMADSVYTEAFKMVSYIPPEDQVEAAYNLARMKQYKAACQYLEEAIIKGYPLSEIKSIDKKVYKGFLKSSYWKNFMSKHDSLRSIYVKSIDPQMLKRVNNMYEKDQQYRSRPGKYKYKEQEKLDSVNLVELNLMIKGYGKIPGVKELGYEGVMLFHIIFRHIDADYLLDTLQDQLVKQVGDGDFRPSTVASAIDYATLARNRTSLTIQPRQKYGTMVMISPISKLGVIIPVEDYKNINRIRESIGLCSLEQYQFLLSYKYIYAEDQLKAELQFLGKDLQINYHDFNFK